MEMYLYGDLTLEWIYEGSRIGFKMLVVSKGEVLKIEIWSIG